MLLQVAAVLVRRVLGREDQRKQCCGQMETLQNLRSVREEVKDEEDAFIAEVRINYILNKVVFVNAKTF